MRFRQRARDLTIEVLIAVVLVTAYVIYLFRFPERLRPDSWKTIGLFVNTIVVFGFLVSWFKHQWKNTQFWLVLGLLLFCHMALFVFFIRLIEHVPLATYVLTNSIELAVFSRILSKAPSLAKFNS